MRALWATIGTVSLISGLLGILLPLLPTVPFILLAAFAFARSSDRMHQWLITHRYFGPMITDWEENRAIGRRAKLGATLSIFAVFGVSLALGLAWNLLLIQAVTLSGVMLFIWTRPEA